MLRFLLNALWFVLGGLVMGLGWWLAGVVKMLLDGRNSDQRGTYCESRLCKFINAFQLVRS